MKMNQPEKAFSIYESAFKHYVEYQDDYLSRQLVCALGTIKALNQMGDAEATQKQIDWLADFARGKKNIPLSFWVDFHISTAKLERDLGHYDNALTSHQKSISYLFPKDIGSSLETNPPINKSFSRVYLLEALREKAFTYEQAFKESGKLKYALGVQQTLMQGIDLVELMVRNADLADRKTRIIQNNYDLYERALAITTELYKLDAKPEIINELFILSERAKALMLIEAWEESVAQLNIPDELLQEKYQLSRDIGMQEFEYLKLIEADTLSKKALGEQENLLLDLRLQQEQWFLEVEDKYPQYSLAKYQTHKLDVNDLQDQLSAKDGWVEYMFTDSLLYIFFLDQSTIQFNIIEASPTSFLTKIESFQKSIQEKSAQRFYQLSHSLYAELLAWIPDIEDYSEIMIIPDGPLCYLPFDLLLTEAVDESHTAQALPYFIQRHTVIYNYSARFWLEGRKFIQQRKPNNELLAFAPEIDRNRILALNVPEVTRDALEPLLGAEAEVKNIQQYFTSNIFIGSPATEAEFRQQASNYAVLHLATHGVIDQAQPLYSKLIFSQGTNNSGLDDGLLHTYELLNMQLNAELTTLSACNTGIGTYQKGEGVVSLARGFAYAGCPNLVMSLWAVPDQATATVMTKFYEGLANGMNKDEALRQAKLFYLDNSPPEKLAPYYWGAWVLVGDAQPLSTNKPLLQYIGGVLLLFAVGLGLWSWKKKNA